MSDRPLTVGTLTRRIADALGDFGPLTVRGELSRVTVVRSGHCYATLKDADAQISLVMWRSTLARHGPLPPEGSAVLVRGSISVYGPRGQYQLMATRVTPEGVGDLAARFEALKAQLLAEGLFDDERKRPLPALPRAIGIATAPGSAALADMLHGVAERFPAMPVLHAPCAVTGPQSAPSIVRALRRLDAHPEVGVIVLGRGGGSLEDLWGFNEEAVVRAIAACATPVVSAVGHETDVTLADLVADVRAKTPTAAIELALPDAAELAERLDALGGELRIAIEERIGVLRERLIALASHRALGRPQHLVAMRMQRLDEDERRLDHRIRARLQDAQHRWSAARHALALLHPRRRLTLQRTRLDERAADLARAARHRRERLEARFAALAGRLDALSPLGVIARGYSVVRRREDDRLVRALDDAPPGTPIRARLADGWLEAETTGGEQRRLREVEDLYRA